MGLLTAWLAEVVLISYRASKSTATGPPIKGLPLPADLAASVIVYGTLGLLTKTRAEPIAVLTGWGLVVATLLDLWTPKALVPGQVTKGVVKTVATAKNRATTALAGGTRLGAL